jgi:tripartite-type tricarboxylate transporter receptor subunit TctC
MKKRATTRKMLLLSCWGLVSALISVSTPVAGADFPTKNITIVTPFPPGSTSDLIPRLVSQIMGQSMGVSVIVENRPGANGSMGAIKVAASPPDGYTVLMATTGVLAINQWIYPKLQYSPEKDFEPVIIAAATPNMLVVNPNVKANNLKELIALAKAKPGELTFASAGNGSTSHLCGESLKVAAGIDIGHVPYQGPAPAVQDVLSGRVTMMCDNLSNVIQHVRAGRLKAIVVTSRERNPQASDIPNSVDAGLPDLEAGIWYSFVVPAATPKDVVNKLNTEFAKALHDPAVTVKLESLGMKIVADKPEEFRQFAARESARMQKVVKASGAQVN